MTNKSLQRWITSIEWWKSKCSEEHIREDMTRLIDELKYLLSKENENV